MILVAREPLTEITIPRERAEWMVVYSILGEGGSSGLIINYPHRWRGMRVRRVSFGAPSSKVSTLGTDVLGRGILAWIGFREIWMGDVCLDWWIWMESLLLDVVYLFSFGIL